MITERLQTLIETANRHLPDRSIGIHFDQWFFSRTQNQELDIKMSVQPGFAADCGHIYFESESELTEWIESGCDLNRVYADGPIPKLRVRPLEVAQ